MKKNKGNLQKTVTNTVDINSTISIMTLNVNRAMAPHSSILAWKIPWTEKPGGPQSMGLQRVRHDSAT